MAAGNIKIGTLVLDASLEEEFSYDSEVSSFPVESGSTITDNIRPLPIKVSIKGVVSDTPIGAMIAVRSEEGFASQDLSARALAATTAERGSQTALELLQFGSDFASSPTYFSPSTKALTDLEDIYITRLPVTIQTTLKTYTSMAMSSLSITRDSTTGAALTFTAKFEQIIIVTNDRTKVRVATRSAGKKQNKGTVILTDAIDTNGNFIIDKPVGDQHFYYSRTTINAATGTQVIDTPLTNAQVEQGTLDNSVGSDYGPSTPENVAPNNFVEAPHLQPGWIN